jgi:hypothetical protein
MKTQEIVDFVIQNLFDMYWRSDKEGELTDFSFRRIMDNRFESYTRQMIKSNSESIVKIASRYRGDVSLEELKKEFDYMVENWDVFIDETKSHKIKRELFYKAYNFFTQNYGAKDIIDLGFLPQSCTSFSIYAFDVMKLLGVQKLRVEQLKAKVEGGGRHSVLIYYDNEKRKMQRCDPKWQKHPVFFREFPECREHFINIADPNNFVHGESEKKPLWYEGPIEIIRE